VKVAYVVPRYGTEVVGGAEYAARMLAERLVDRCGWEVSVLTTCAQDARTWADEYPPGEVEVNGVRVHRFRSQAGRDRGFEAFSAAVLADAAAASPEAGRRWIELQGPVCPAVVDAAAGGDFDLVVFYPYLYYPTVHGVPAVGSRAVMHPAAHDEAPIRLPLFREVFAAARGLVFQTEGERRLAHRLFPGVAATPQLLLGLGVEPGPGDPTAAGAAVGLAGRPYLLCVGRVDEGKGTTLLARYFAAYKERRPGPLALVLAGPVVSRPPANPDIVVAGPVDEPVKWGLLRGATALVSPSPLEAFSLVLVEAWAAGRPVLVNAACLATTEHVARSGGGLRFGGYGQFEVAVERLTAGRVLADRLAAAGRAYADANFAWPVLIDRYRAFLEAVAARR